MGTKLTPTQAKLQLKQHRENRKRLVLVEKELVNLKATVETHIATTERIKQDTAILVDILQNAKTGVRAITFAAKFAKVLGVFVAAMVIAWSAVQAAKSLIVTYSPVH